MLQTTSTRYEPPKPGKLRRDHKRRNSVFKLGDIVLVVVYNSVTKFKDKALKSAVTATPSKL
jgi:hypothetical protein